RSTSASTGDGMRADGCYTPVVWTSTRADRNCMRANRIYTRVVSVSTRADRNGVRANRIYTRAVSNSTRADRNGARANGNCIRALGFALVDTLPAFLTKSNLSAKTDQSNHHHPTITPISGKTKKGRLNKCEAASFFVIRG